MNQRIFVIITIITTNLTVFSCTTANIYKAYSGPELSKGQIAVIEVLSGWAVHSIDNESITPPSTPYLLGVLPGKRILSISLEGYFNRESVEFNAIEGHSYSFICRTDYIESMNRHFPKYCGIQDNFSPGSMKLIWERKGGIEQFLQSPHLR